jgi:hypothetical protein
VTYNAMNDLLTEALWAAMIARLDTATMRGILNVTGSAPTDPAPIYLAGRDDFSGNEGDENEDWGRLVLVPTSTLWSRPEGPGMTRPIGFLARSEFNDYTAEGYNPARGLELSQREVYRRLQGWTPTGLDDVLVALPVFRHRAPDPVPVHDQPRGLLLLSSEYRTEVSGLAP